MVAESENEVSLGQVEQLMRRGEFALAESACARLIDRNPTLAQAWSHLGYLRLTRGALTEGEQAIRQAVALAPQNSEYWNNLSGALLYQKKLDEAGQCARQAISLGNPTAAPWSNLGLIAFTQCNFTAAVEAYQLSLRIAPNDVAAWENLGTAQQELGIIDEAIVAFERAAALQPSAIAFVNLGGALEEAGRFDDAAACFRRALRLQPDSGQALWRLGILALRSGDFPTGWLATERGCDLVLPTRSFTAPRWDGRPFPGKALLLYAEQGLGDTIHYARYVELTKRLGGSVILECQPPLQKLLANLAGADTVVPHGAALPPFDLQYPLARLPGLFQTTLDSIPHRVPYLHADSELVSQWSVKLADRKRFRIAINWSGKADFARNRHIPPHYFAELSELDGIDLISIQKHAESGLLDTSAESPTITSFADLDQEHGPFMDTAAIMRNVDLVITSDTSIAHLAGALAVPVWVVLPFIADWRWFLDRTDSPWYPTMRLFRQRQRGDWDSAFSDIKAALLEQIVPQRLR
jgi:tetratricopeptide (TPR) repeat protein